MMMMMMSSQIIYHILLFFYLIAINGFIVCKIGSNLKITDNGPIHPIKPDLLISEFEILDMSGHDGRMQNGYCCNGIRPIGSQCKGGNTTCLPYWRVCIVEMTPDMTGPIFASRRRSDDHPQTISHHHHKPQESRIFPSISTTTTKKPSVISNFFSKILGFYGVGSRSSTDRTKLKEILDKISPSTCRVGFWTSDVIQSDTQFPITMRGKLNWQMTPNIRNTGGYGIDRNVMCIVEIWSKNPRIDSRNRLIARQIQHYNVFMDSDTTSSDWFYGGKQLPSPDAEFASSTSSISTSSIVASTETDRRKDKDSKTSTNFDRHRYLSGYMTRTKSSIISSVTTNQPTGVLLSNWIAPIITGQTYPTSSNNNMLKTRQTQPSIPNPSVFRYKFRWHVKVLSRNKIQTSRDGTPNTDSNNANSILFGYNDEDLDDLISLNLTADGCPHGYQGSDCSIPICMEGCDQDHGYCEQPGQCLCKFGWTGMDCSYCLTLFGCVHGHCSRPLECRCEEGWTGVFCSTPKCKDGCHQINGYCTVPGECKCKFGWQGENCTECSTLPGCQHGTCQDSLDCICEPGWHGTFCSTPICSPNCANGWCRRPNECRCKVGFRGENCTECVPYPGCEHGGCAGTITGTGARSNQYMDSQHQIGTTNSIGNGLLSGPSPHTPKPWTCECESGWGGFTCNERLNWCELPVSQRPNITMPESDDQSTIDSTSGPILQPNPCQNGGTCISVERSNGYYLCQCTLGYTGKHCELIAN